MKKKIFLITFILIIIVVILIVYFINYSTAYTICTYNNNDSNFFQEFTIYTDKSKKYVEKEKIVSKITYDTITEAITAENEELENCNAFADDIIDCKITRNNKMVFSKQILKINSIESDENIYYHDVIKNIEELNYTCIEKH